MPVVQSHGIDIYFESRGSGPPLVLLHSFLCSGRMWDRQLEPLSARHRLINIDLRGHGRSGVIEGPFTLYDLVDDVIAVLDEMEIESATWAGLSIGGMIALRAALRSPARVSRLLLLDTDGGPEKGWIRLKYRGLGWIARTIGLGPIRPQIARQMFGVTTRREQPRLVVDWTEIFSANHIPSVLWTLESLVTRDDLTPELGGIDVPALVVVGREDASLPPERSRALAAALPGAELVEIDGAGHLSALEQPSAVNQALLAFLEIR